MASDSEKARNGRPFLFTNLKTMDGVDQVVDWIKKSVLLEE
jgi:urease accessory protein